MASLRSSRRIASTAQRLSLPSPAAGRRDGRQPPPWGYCSPNCGGFLTTKVSGVLGTRMLEAVLPDRLRFPPPNLAAQLQPGLPDWAGESGPIWQPWRPRSGAGRGPAPSACHLVPMDSFSHKFLFLNDLSFQYTSNVFGLLTNNVLLSFYLLPILPFTFYQSISTNQCII